MEQSLEYSYQSSASILYAYDQADSVFSRELDKHLSNLKRQSIITNWYARDINLEAYGDELVDKRINTVQLILVLISPDFLASDYCYGIEMQRALERHDAGECVVAPILLRPTDWRNSPFYKLHFLPADAKPISVWDNRDEAFLSITQGIQQIITHQSNFPLSIYEAGQQKDVNVVVEIPDHIKAGPIKLFYAYAQPDETLYYELEKHLSGFRRQGIITDWYARNINLETDRTEAFDQHINTAQLILLLISPDFLASDYCYGIEIQRALERHDAGEAMVVPILLRPIYWEKSPFSRLPVLPSEGKPVTKWADLDAAFMDIVSAVSKIITSEAPTHRKQHEMLDTANIYIPRVNIGPIKLFFSYARADIHFCEALEKHLTPLQRQGIIRMYNDRQIIPGEQWEISIKNELESAHIILLLISPDFIASDYCYSIEMQRSLERHNAGEVIVLPIILRPVRWENTPLGHLQALPAEAKPISMWIDRDDAFADVARGINQIVQTLLARPSQKTKEQWMLEGKAFYDSEQYDKALAAYEQAQLIDRKDENVHLVIGRAHFYAGHYSWALDAYEESIRLSATASAYLFKGMVLQRLGRSADALEAYLKAREYGYRE